MRGGYVLSSPPRAVARRRPEPAGRAVDGTVTPARRRARRALLLAAAGGAAALWVAGLRGGLPSLWPVDLSFEPMADPPGFRRLVGGEVSPGRDPLAGLESAPPGPDRPALSPPAMCRALFRDVPPAGVVPIALFVDANCPYCRVLERRLRAMAAEHGAGLAIAWHEWPILGPVSRQAARAAEAARLQGAYPPVQKALAGTRFLPTEAYLRRIAARAGLDPDRLIRDMEAARVVRRLARTARLAERLGFAGTPGLVVGRTVSEGAIGSDRLSALIERERAAGAVPGCAPRHAHRQAGPPRAMERVDHREAKR